MVDLGPDLTENMGPEVPLEASGRGLQEAGPKANSRVHLLAHAGAACMRVQCACTCKGYVSWSTDTTPAALACCFPRVESTARCRSGISMFLLGQ